MRNRFESLVWAVAFSLSGAGLAAPAGTKGKVLVVLSSEAKITLKGGTTHPTGFFLPELMEPLEKVMEAGYEPVFANPRGNEAVLDKVSDTDFWYGNTPGATAEARQAARETYRRHRRLCERVGVCSPDGLVGPAPLRKLSDVRREGLDRFRGVFFPGGHAPMEDLWRDEEVGHVLRHFHAAGKPTGLICHGPIALLAALDDPEGFVAAKIRDDRAAVFEKSRDWIYRGYAVTVFTTREEQQEEPGQDDLLGGYVRFYPDQTLEVAGAYVKRADKWKPNVVRDRELVTGQNPFSHEAFAGTFVDALEGNEQ